MTTEEKKAALIEAGRKIRSNASEETIEEAWEEYQAELEADAILAEEPEEEETSEVESAPIIERPEVPPISQPVRSTVPERKPGRVLGSPEWHAAFAACKSHKYGVKEPELVEWCRQNMSAEEFSEVYPNK